MNDLALRSLTKRYGPAAAVDGVTLDIPGGRFICLLGPSGCGKTTLLRLIAGLETPTEGRILVGGEDITDRPTHRRDFGMVFQSLALFPHLSVGDNVAYPLAIRGRPKAERDRRAAELLELVRLPGLAGRRIHQLSGGQRQRVAIARALAVDPRLFLLDEPLSALDAALRDHMQMELRQLQTRLGITTLVVTHDQKEALTMADLVIVMDKGRVQQMGAPMEIYRDPANAFVAGFIGSSNLLPATLLDRSMIEVSGRRIPLAPQDRVKTAPGPALLSVRPEDVRLAEEGLPARVTFIRDLGESVQIVLDQDGREMTALFAPRERPDVQIGETVQLAFAPGGVVVLAP
ncbi:ABC-type spermidine/putrescine transport system, ATPase component [Rubellimicrobium thermophilum DSM 16684]|uniref:ABC-type spermidine/putrescine transport system, ATPase component n=1 Tax=Rubellimicrobium thermophilum DSM 16684 TaxID=1123069 RepID=S9S3T6_9RHOB|nr:ABC transporter ATP-binding protein [Rubellimicrobium thermophilum]EPX84860.1 ABC-type spermidine/putrescine transport system, ATPase component [Rubellimicrobium thermophilum DSM 16684]